ncbi:FecR family protein [Compostibacter hankyongensis]|uniref:DUF4974 domain-containing protein n=1 Tax=Compostibacter hankyongensis TaxID=1007089 RepID=A0ABP8FZA2_9BACT
MQEGSELSGLFEIAELLRRSIDGVLTPAETRVLQQWIGEWEENARLYDNIRNTAYREEQLLKMQQFDVEQGWRKAASRLAVRSSPKRYFRRAAAILLLLGASVTALLLRHHNDARQTAALIENDVPAGTTRAYLSVAGGKSVILNQAGDTAFLAGNLRVRQQHGMLRLPPEPADKNRPVQYLDLHTPRAGEYQLLLEDGTRVWLNAASTLHFPDHFSGPERMVSLSGEAYFEVAHDARKPFTVLVNGVKIRALGTAFNIHAYPEEGALQTALVSGVVEVRNRQERVRLSPGEMATVTPEGTAVALTDITMATAWKDGLFLFRNVDLSAVMLQLARWYDVEVTYAPGFKADSRFSARISRQVPLSRLLQLMEQTSIARFSLSGKKVTVLPYEDL